MEDVVNDSYFTYLFFLSDPTIRQSAHSQHTCILLLTLYTDSMYDYLDGLVLDIKYQHVPKTLTNV